MNKFIKWLLGLLLWGILIFLILCISPKATKEDMAQYYDVSRPTFLKWMKHFYDGPVIIRWKTKRTLSINEQIQIRKSFGVGTTMSKLEIAKKADTDLKILADSIKKFGHKIGITAEMWKSCDKFPPSVALKIISLV